MQQFSNWCLPIPSAFDEIVEKRQLVVFKWIPEKKQLMVSRLQTSVDLLSRQMKMEENKKVSCNILNSYRCYLFSPYGCARCLADLKKHRRAEVHVVLLCCLFYAMAAQYWFFFPFCLVCARLMEFRRNTRANLLWKCFDFPLSLLSDAHQNGVRCAPC